MSNQASQEVLAKVEDQWKGRAKMQGFRPKTVAYRKAEVEFFCGAMASLTAQGYDMPVGWTMSMLSGRPVVEV